MPRRIDAQKLSDALLVVGVELCRLQGERADALDRCAEIEAKIAAVTKQHHDLVHAAFAGEEARPSPTSDTNGASVPIENGAKEPLRLKVLRCVARMGGVATVPEIIAGLGEDERRVVFCLRDLRAKAKWFDRPENGRWRLSEKGKNASEKLLNSN